MVTLFLTIAVLLVAFGGLMAAVDAAISTLNRAEIAELAVGARTPKSLLAIGADPGSHQNAVNFVRVLAETTAAVLVTIAFGTVIASPWLVLVESAVVMTAVSFVLVGASPRSVGRAHARGILRFAAIIVRSIRLLLGPVAGLLVRLGNAVTPSRARTPATFTSEEQLLSMVDEATDLDLLEDDDRDLIHSVFEWGDTVVREVMVPRTDMVTVEGSVSAKAALKVMLSRGLSRLPVTGRAADDIQGVVHLRDLARVVAEKEQGVRTSQLMRPVLYVPDSKTADDTLRQMQRESNHLAMVVDEYGGIAGLVTMEDLIEELVGEISDESDHGGDEVEQTPDGGYRVSARLPLHELADLLDHEVDDEDVETVGGLLTKALGHLPARGETATVAGLRLVADRTDGRRHGLTRVAVSRLESA